MIRKFLRRQIRRYIKRYITTPRAIRSYLAGHKTAKLQIGAGTNCLQGWLNTDLYLRDKRILYLDAGEPFPFSDNVFGYILSEHQFEHLTFDKGRQMLKECCRVLKPGGRIRIATPDLRALVDMYQRPEGEIQREYICWKTEKFLPELAKRNLFHPAYVINSAFYDSGHRFLYDEHTLTNLLAETGFEKIVRYEAGRSDDTVLQDVEMHGKFIRREDLNRFETLVLEAQKPGMS